MREIMREELNEEGITVKLPSEYKMLWSICAATLGFNLHSLTSRIMLLSTRKRDFSSMVLQTVLRRALSQQKIVIARSTNKLIVTIF